MPSTPSPKTTPKDQTFSYSHHQQPQDSKMSTICFNSIVHLFRILLSGSAWTISCDSALATQIKQFVAIFHESLLYSIVYVALVVIKAFVIFAVYLRYKRPANSLLQKINKKLAVTFRYYKQLDLVLTTYLLSVNITVNIIPFCLSLLLQLYDMVFVQDFIVRKNLYYARSIKSYYFFRLYVVAIYVIDASSFHFQNALIFNACFFGLNFLFLAKFSLDGMRVMGMEALNRMISFELFFYVSMFYSACLRKSNEETFSSSTISQYFLVVSVLFFYTQCKKRASWIELSTQPHSNIKQYELLMASLLLLQSDADVCAFTEGVLAFHRLDNCSNPSCFAKKSTIYDSLTNQVISIHSPSHKASLIKMHLQCLYEQVTNKNTSTHEDIFNYCEFLYNESGNKTKLVLLLHTLHNQDLDGIERIQYYKYQQLLLSIFKSLNDSLYDGNLPFEKVIEMEERIQSIQKKIETYLLRYCQIWRLFDKSQVDVRLIDEQFIGNMKLVEELDKEWKEFGSFIDVSKQWKRLYYNYHLFIKNEKIKNKDIQEIKNDHSGNPLPKHPKIFNKSILFNENAIFFNAILEENQLLIINTCSKFQENTGYDRQELLNCGLDIILPDQLAKIHNEKVCSWLDQCYQTHESSYLIQESELVTKQGEKLPVIKLFKVCQSIENGFEFACFLLFQDQSPQRIHNEGDMCFYATAQNLAVDCMNRSEPNSSPRIRQANQSNIFLKDVPNHQQDFMITRFISLSRLLSLIAILCLSLSITTISTNNSNLITHSNQFINFMHIYRLPIILNINYLKSSLQVGNATKSNKVIAASTNTMLSFVSNPLTISTIFDANINEPKIYRSDGGYAQFANASYNQIDLFYTIASSIMSLSKGPVNRTSKQYKEFSTFLKPAYDDMINGTKNRLHETFKQLIKDSQTSQIYITVSGVVIFVGLFIVLFYQLTLFFRRMKAVASIIKDFPERHLRTIEKYCRDIRLHFLALSISQGAKPTLHEQDLENVTNGKGNNLNKKPNNLINGSSKVCSKVIALKAAFFLVSAISISLLIMLVLLNISQIRQIFKFQQAGFYFLRYFPTGPIITMGALEKYYSLTYPQQKIFNASKYDDVISSMEIFGSFPYIGSTQNNSQYFQKQKNYFFGNPCTYNPSLLAGPDVSVSTCLTISNGTFSQGISSYLRYSQRLASSYIRGEPNLTVSELNEYTISVTISTVYVLDAISTWITQFIQKVEYFNKLNINIAIIIISVIVVLHIVLVEWIIKGMLRKEHQFAMQMYRYCVPEFLLRDEKVIRQRFILEGLIDQD